MTYDFRDAYLIPGWCYPRELEQLSKILTFSSCHVEIGAFCGKSLYATCIGLAKNATVYAVEPCDFNENDTPGLQVPNNEWVKNVLNNTLVSIEQKRPDLKISLLISDSLMAAEHLAKHKITPTSVYIDGDHNYEEVKNDIITWYHSLAFGGRLIGHDYWAACPGVIDAVEEIFEGKAIVIKGTRLWYFDKPFESDDNRIPKALTSSQY